MNILVFDFGAYTMPDIIETFQKEHIRYRLVSYHFADKNHDEFFIHRFTKFLIEDSYDAVFSVNYFPLIARCCQDKNVKYISWSYDNPLNVPNIEETLGLETNYVFLFDRIQVEKYWEMGFTNVFHMPLAVNTTRLSNIKLTNDEIKKYKSPISFVGKLYESPLSAYMSLMDDYCKGYIQSVCEVQLKLYGAYVIDGAITDSILERMNQNFKTLNQDTEFEMTKEALSYAMAAQVTRNERLILLKLLSKYYGLKLYTRDDSSLIPQAMFMGSCGYLYEMPKIFKASDVNLNISLKIIQSGMSLRMLDVLGARGFLLSNYQIELADFFENDKEVVMYESIEDAHAKAGFYLKNSNLREQIAKNGFQKVKNCFSYEAKLKEIFQISGCLGE